MKILFCAYDRPGYIATGPNAWIQRLIPDLRDNFNIDIIPVFFISVDPKECPTIQFFEQKGIRGIIIDTKKYNYVEDQVKQLIKIVKVEKAKVLVANLVISGYYASRYLNKSNVPVIGVLHSNDSFYKTVINKFVGGEKKNTLTHFVGVSNYLQNLAQQKNKHKTPLSTIPCGTPESNHIATFDKGDTLKIIYAGRIEEEQKQILKLTKAFILASQNNSHLEFSIYGSGSKSEEINTIINEASNHKVKFYGAISPQDIQKVMAQHQIFTLMSDYEGMPVALMEAMSLGCVPVCLNEESGINEIISHGKNGFIVKDRTSDFQEKLNSLANDQRLWELMSVNARKTIQKSYSSNVTHQQWADLLNTFKYQEIKKIHIPLKIKITGAKLFYGDNRKPPLKQRLKVKVNNYWFKFRLVIRPRALLKQLIN